MGIKRDYDNAFKSVKLLYKNQRIRQTAISTKKSIEKHCKFTNKNTFWELFDMTDIKDISDPDINLDNYYHFYQIAEESEKMAIQNGYN